MRNRLPRLSGRKRRNWPLPAAWWNRVSSHPCVLRCHLGDLIEVALRGEEAVIAQDDQPVLKLVPVIAPKTRRTAGSAKGLWWVTSNFHLPYRIDSMRRSAQDLPAQYYYRDEPTDAHVWIWHKTCSRYQSKTEGRNQRCTACHAVQRFRPLQHNKDE